MSATYQHTRTGRAVLRSLVPVICPAEAHGLADAIVDHLALQFGVLPPVVRTALEAGLLAYDLGALPRFRRRAHALPPARAEAYYGRWEHGITPLHVQFARALKQLVSLSCYEQPAMMERCGYRPAPFIEEVKQRRLAVYRDDIARQDVQILAPDPLRPGVRVHTPTRTAAPASPRKERA